MEIFPINERVLFYDNYKANCNCGIIFRKTNSLFSGIRNYVNKLPTTLLASLWYTKSFKNCGETEDTIILFDTFITIYAANYIKNRWPNLRVIYWFWNHINDPTTIQKINSGIEIWSYDQEDCKKYNLKFNTQFYFPELSQDIKTVYNDVDMFFIGLDKGRNELIEGLKKIFDKYGFSHRLMVISKPKFKLKSNKIPYNDVCKHIASCKCIVDIIPDTQKGMSIRPLEALYFGKKIITNYKEIVNTDIYHPDNIFVVGIDREENLSEFMSRPLHIFGEYIYEKYSFRSWLKRF